MTAALETLSDSEDKNINENIKTWAKDSLDLYEMKQHKPWLLDQSKQTKMQWLEDPKKNNVYSLNNVRCEARKHFRKKRRNIWKQKLMNVKLTVR
jgi:hypothetical protein